MQTISFIPGAVVTPNPINIPATALFMSSVVGAYILRMGAGFAIPDHPQADVIAAVADHPQADVAGALADHPVHQHDITTVTAAGGGSAMTEPAVAGALETAGAGQTNPNAVDANAAAQAHAAGAAAVAHAAGAAAVAHGAATGANPVVAATATLVDHDTITLNVSTELGDILYLTYIEEGSVLKVS